MTLGMFEYAKRLDQKPPAGCTYNVGDTVTFTNDYGVQFHGMKVIGFSDNLCMIGRLIHLNGDAYWFPHKASELTLTSDTSHKEKPDNE